MDLIRIVDREHVIRLYCGKQHIIKKYAALPEWLDWNDANALDFWLSSNQYKWGVISGFRQWAYVRLSQDDLLDLAIVDHFDMFEGQPSNDRRLRNLVDTERFRTYTLKYPKPWFAALSNGDFSDDLAIIVRPACKSERKFGARMYVEDGAGRVACYLGAIHRLKIESAMTAYLGFDPDPRSKFLQTQLEKEFASNEPERYSTIDATFTVLRSFNCNRAANPISAPLN